MPKRIQMTRQHPWHARPPKLELANRPEVTA